MLFEVQRYTEPVAYQKMWQLQKDWVQQIDQAALSNQLLLLEHQHTITLGRGSDQANLLHSHESYRRHGVEVVEIDRGGDVTYHGPGQLVGYPLFFLGKYDSHQYLRDLEEVLIQTLKHWGIEANRKDKYTGVWVGNEKIAAIGVKFHRGRSRRGYITSHGFALNVKTDLSYFEMIVPCGITEYGVTSMEKILQKNISMDQVKNQVIESTKHLFSHKLPQST